MDSKPCTKCKINKPLTDFFKRNNGASYKSACKECMVAFRKEWGKQNCEKVKEYLKDQWVKHERRFKRRGITKEMFLEKVKQQNGVCAICHSEDDLVIDHNHNTNEFRGALCRNCNRALGLFGDNVNTLKNAVEYLEQNGFYGLSDESR